jgi:hypothetical protein
MRSLHGLAERSLRGPQQFIDFTVIAYYKYETAASGLDPYKILRAYPCFEKYHKSLFMLNKTVNIYGYLPNLLGEK